jgi:hypothetical protein
MSAWMGPGLPRLPDTSRRVVSVANPAKLTASLCGRCRADDAVDGRADAASVTTIDDDIPPSASLTTTFVAHPGISRRCERRCAAVVSSAKSQRVLPHFVAAITRRACGMRNASWTARGGRTSTEEAITGSSEVTGFVPKSVSVTVFVFVGVDFRR